MGRLDFVSELTYIIITEVDMDHAFVCLQGFSHHSIIIVLVSDVEDLCLQKLLVLAEVHNIARMLIPQFPSRLPGSLLNFSW